MSLLTEQHGGELRPTGETLGVALGLVLVDQSGEFNARNLLKQLTEETGCLYHEAALRGCVMNLDFSNLILPRQRRASSNPIF